MNGIAGRYGSGLKPFMVRFFITAALLLVVAVVCVTQFRQRKLLEKTSEGLTQAQSGLARVKTATANRRHVLAALQSQFGQGAQGNSPEMILYAKVDELKARLNPDDMTITGVEKKGGEASLQYTLTFSNPDFNWLLNTVSDLHRAVFPLTPVSSIVVTQTEVKGAVVVSFKVSGKMIVSEKAKP